MYIGLRMTVRKVYILGIQENLIYLDSAWLLTIILTEKLSLKGFWTATSENEISPSAWVKLFLTKSVFTVIKLTLLGLV